MDDDTLHRGHDDDDDDIDNDNEDHVISLQDRLIAVKQAIRKATAEAVKQSHSSHQTFAKPQFDRDDNNDSSTTTVENRNPNASFLLGMELFKQDPSKVEQEIQKKLHDMEQELQHIVQQVNDTHTTATSGTHASTSSSWTTTSPQHVQQEVSRLTQKVAFLQECSKARALLDECITLSTSALKTEPDLVLAAQCLAQAQQAAQHAEHLVIQQQKQHPTTTPENEPPSQAVLAAFRIVDSILHPIRRKRVELIARALSLLESSITITASSLTVKGGREPHLAPDNNNNNEGDNSRHTPISQGISAAFQMLEAFDEQGSSALQEVIRKLTKRLYDEVFLPVLNDYRHAARNNLQTTIAKTPWIFHETTSRSNANLEHLAVATNTSSASGIKHHLKWHRTNENKANEGKEEGTTTSTLNTPIAAWKETFAFLQRILAFIEEHMLLQRTNLTQLVGKRLFGKPDALPTSLSLEALGIQSTLLAEDHGVLTETILELVNETCVPSYLTVEQIQALPASADELRSFVKPFEAFLVNKSFLLPPHLSGEKASSDITRLGNFVDNLEQNYIEKRRCTILNEARNILLNKDYHNTVEVGVEVKSNKGTDLEMLDDDGMSVFQLHKSCISQSSSQLMQLCRNTMEEAVQHSSIPIDSPLALLSANLYRTARDILELFRAIIPSALSQEIAHVPRTAALLHNDCVFFSHHCLTLGLEYKDRFPAPEENKQGNLLRQTCLFVDMVPPFRDLANRSMGDMLDLQKHQLVEIVGDRITYLGETLLSNESVAEWSEAETALTAGIYHLRHLSQAWRPILSQQVFSRSMGHLADAIFALYLEQVLRVSDISQSGCHFVRALFEKASRSTMALLNDDTTGSRLWDRFTAIGSFMDMSLADIETALAQGVFRNVTGPELSRLITATFADTEKRRNLLRLLVVD